MPLTEKGKKIMGHMRKEYGKKKGKNVFYASANKGTITGVHGSGPFSQKEVNQGFKVCYNASNLDKLDESDFDHTKTRKNHMRKMEMEY